MGQVTVLCYTPLTSSHHYPDNKYVICELSTGGSYVMGKVEPLFTTAQGIFHFTDESPALTGAGFVRTGAQCVGS